MKVIITQSMYFPWVGLLEQVRLADIVVHYDDVQFTRGFFNRVQVKTAQGPRWLTVPVRDHHRGQQIDECAVDDAHNWRRQHRDVLHQACREAPFVDEMMQVVDCVFKRTYRTIAEVSRASMMALVEYFGLSAGRRFVDSAALVSRGRGSDRILRLVKEVGGDTYVTGHGARNYLDHGAFDDAGVAVLYMNYQRLAYPQLHGAFTPYVTALDLIANCGPAGEKWIRPATLPWKEFLQ